MSADRSRTRTRGERPDLPDRGRPTPPEGARAETPVPAQAEAAGPAESAEDSRSIPALLRELSAEGSELVREEIALARAEVEQKVETYRRASMTMAAGGALMLAALLALLWTLNYGLTALLAQNMDLEIAVWLAPLILAVLFGGIGLALVLAGRKRMSDEGLRPRETTESLKENKRWVQARAREAREEIRHGA